MDNKEYRLIEFIDNDFRLDVRVDEYGMVWLSMNEMAKLFNVQKAAIAKHLQKYSVVSSPTVSILETVRFEGNREVRRKIQIYNLEIILAIGYKVNSKRTAVFKKWYEDNVKWDKNSNNLVKNELQIVKFTDGGLNIDVSVDPTEDTVWLTVAQIAILFERDEKTIYFHIRNVFSENEVDEKRNSHFLRIANSDKLVTYYSLDVIISVGYRVKSKRGILFRKWASNVLRNYLIKGYSINEARCLECNASIVSLNNDMRWVKKKLLENDDKSRIDLVSKNDIPSATKTLTNIFNLAKNKIMIIDPYADEVLINMLKGYKVNIIIYTLKAYLDDIKLDYNIRVIKKKHLHSRYILIDDKLTYFITHSFNGINDNSFEIIYLEDFKPEYVLLEINNANKE